MVKQINSAEFIRTSVFIVTENADGEIYHISADSFQDLIKDWNGDCRFVPSNDAKVFFAAHKGKAIDPNRYSDFVSLLRYLEMAENADQPLMLRLLEAGYPRTEMYHHESDLYVYVTPVTSAVIRDWCREHGYSRTWHCPIFQDQITGKPMYDRETTGNVGQALRAGWRNRSTASHRLPRDAAAL